MKVKNFAYIMMDIINVEDLSPHEMKQNKRAECKINDINEILIKKENSPKNYRETSSLDENIMSKSPLDKEDILEKAKVNKSTDGLVVFIKEENFTSPEICLHSEFTENHHSDSPSEDYCHLNFIEKNHRLSSNLLLKTKQNEAHFKESSLPLLYYPPESSSTSDTSCIRKIGLVSNSFTAVADQNRDALDKEGIYQTEPSNAEKPFMCHECNKTFLKKKNLANHLKLHSETFRNQFVCPVCEKGFVQNSYLKDHAKTHMAIKPFQCTECNKAFTRKNVLKKHLKIHLGVRPFTCHLCSSSFIEKSQLMKHFKIHSQESPFVCSQCDKGFRTRAHLRRHELIHSGTKPYSCFICNQRFTQKYHMLSHTKTHDGSKSFQCNLCDKVFTRNARLTEHMKQHNVEMPYSCPYCIATYLRESSLTVHMRKHLSEDIPHGLVDAERLD